MKFAVDPLFAGVVEGRAAAGPVSVNGGAQGAVFTIVTMDPTGAFTPWSTYLKLLSVCLVEYAVTQLVQAQNGNYFPK